MRFCGIDVSGGRRGQHLCVLEERGPQRLVATFYEPAPVERVVQAVLSVGEDGEDAVVAIDAPSGPRRDLLAHGRPLRATLGLADGRYERARVCDAIVTRRRLPLYQVPAAGQPVATWMACGFELFEALRSLRLYRPPADGAVEGPVGVDALNHGRLAETYPHAAFCALLGHRPLPKGTPGGGKARIEALERCGVVDADLWRRTLDELDACVAAYTAYALATGRAFWVGDPDEGVIVLPVERLEAKYDRLEKPKREQWT